VTLVTTLIEVNEQAFIEMCEGKNAPMPLLAIQGFVNTLDVEDGTDLLDTTESFRKFLEDTDQVVPGFEIKPHHLPLAKELRAATRECLEANSSGEPDPKATARMIAGARTLTIDLEPDEEGNLELDLSPVDSFARLGSQLLAIAFQSQIEGTWERLKLCENPECRWAFYDSSRNKSGSWCRMGLCGNRLKNRAYRERHRGEIAGSTTAAAVRPGRPQGS
jgi:predicted RNA-binding Zn ribbon-like protein